MDIPQRNMQREDIYIRDGKIADIGRQLEYSDAQIIDVGGRYVTTGWIDAHAHLYYGVEGAIGIDPDTMIRHGVTYAVDAGTAGQDNIQELMALCDTRTMPCGLYMNLAPKGVFAQYGELTCLDQIDVSACEEAVRQHKDRILGLKLRIDPRVCENAETTMQMIRGLSDSTGKPIIVHASRTELSMEQVLSYLQKDDVFAHTYANLSPGLLDEKGNVKEAAWNAKERGVFFDVSHGKSNFSFKIAEKAIQQGFLPDSISTDMHKGSRMIVESLPMTMSKMMACGLNLWQTLELVTQKPAHMLGLNDYQPAIVVGKEANLTIFEVQEGSFSYSDSEGEERIGAQKIVPYAVCLADQVVMA